MADYQVGGVELLLKSSSDKAVASLSALIGKVGELDTKLTAIIPTFKTIDTLSQSIKSVGKISIRGVTNQLDKLGNIDLDKLEKSFEKLTGSVKPFISELKQGESTIKALANTSAKITGTGKSVKKVADETKKVGNAAKKAEPSFKSMFNVGKLYLVFNYAKRYANAFADVIKSANNFIETVNLFQSSFKDLTTEALKFNNKLAASFGISQTALLSMQATFNNMLKGMGNLDSSLAAGLSQTLSKMVIDYASLFNKSIESSQLAFESVLSGQKRPIRSGTGIDATDVTLMQEYVALGGTKTARQLNQTEKRLLSILTIMKQMGEAGAAGDWQKMIEQPANQLKILSEQLKETKRWFGSLFLGMISQALPYINAFVMTVNQMVKSLAVAMGWTFPELEMPADPFSELTDEAENAVAEIRGLFSFDKFEVLQTGGDNSAGIDQKILEELIAYQAEYDALMSDVSMKATEMSEKWLSWFGYVKDINDETGEITWNLEDGKTKIQEIIDKAKMLFSIISGFMLAKKITDIISLIAKLRDSTSDLNKAMKAAFNPKTIGIAAIAALLIYAYTSNEEFRESINKILSIIVKLANTLFRSLQPALDVVVKILDSLVNTVLAPILELLAYLIEYLDEAGVLFETVAIAATLLVGIKLSSWLSTASAGVFALNSKMLALLGTTKGMQIGVAALAIGLISYISSLKDMGNTAKWLIPVLAGVMAVIAGIAVAKAAMAAGIAAPIQAGITAAALAAGITLAVGTAIAATPKYAEGGFPERGQMFIAREAGAEMVGNIGGHTAVANNDQIVEAVSAGVASAVERVLVSNESGMSLMIDLRGADDSAVGRLFYNSLQKEAGRRSDMKVRKV